MMTKMRISGNTHLRYFNNDEDAKGDDDEDGDDDNKDEDIGIIGNFTNIMKMKMLMMLVVMMIVGDRSLLGVKCDNNDGT